MTIALVTRHTRAVASKINEIIAAINAGPTVESGSYSPTWTNLAVGTGGSAANSAGYRYIGEPNVGGRGFLAITGGVVLGTSGASVSGAPSATLPTALDTGVTGFEMQTAVNSSAHRIGLCTLGSSSIGVVQRVASEANKFGFSVFNAAGTYLSLSTISSTVPLTWAAGDFIRYDFFVSAIRV